MALTHDLRYVLRSLWHHRTLTATAVLTLALGIGANTTLFSVVNAVLLRPLPLADADRLAVIWCCSGCSPAWPPSSQRAGSMG